jgi:hypothetical protein
MCQCQTERCYFLFNVLTHAIIEKVSEYSFNIAVYTCFISVTNIRGIIYLDGDSRTKHIDMLGARLEFFNAKESGAYSYHFLKVLWGNSWCIGKSKGKATGWDGLGIESRWGWGRDFPHSSSPDLGPTQPPMPWVQGLFPGGKAAGAWRWPSNTSSAEVKERVELYFYSPSGLSWPVLGWTLPLPLYHNRRCYIP